MVLLVAYLNLFSIQEHVEVERIDRSDLLSYLFTQPKLNGESINRKRLLLDGI
jgi:hypothetical protein